MAKKEANNLENESDNYTLQETNIYADDILTQSSCKNIFTFSLMENCNTVKGVSPMNKPPMPMVTLMKQESSTAEETSSPFDDDDEDSTDDDSSASSSSSSSNSNSLLSDSYSTYTMISEKSVHKIEDEKENKFFHAYLKKLKQRKGKKYGDALKSIQSVIDHEVNRAPCTEVMKPIEGTLIDTGSDCDKTGYLVTLVQGIRFEINHFMPTAIALVAYSVAHISLYEFLNTFIYDATKNLEVPGHYIFSSSILTGFLLSRFSGSAWNWLNEESYSNAKIEIRKRVRMGYFDTKIQLWFKKHKVLRSGVGLLSFYLTHIGMVYFICFVLLPYVGDNKKYFLNNLPSQKIHNSSTSVTELLLNAINGDSTDSSCKITQGDYHYMYDKMTVASYSYFFGSHEAALVTTFQTLIFYFVVAICSISTLMKLKIGLD